MVVGAFSVIVKTDCETDGSSAALLGGRTCPGGAPPRTRAQTETAEASSSRHIDRCQLELSTKLREIFQNIQRMPLPTTY